MIVCRYDSMLYRMTPTLHDALKIFLISSHFPFHIFTLYFIFCLSHACCCLNEKKIKLNYSVTCSLLKKTYSMESNGIYHRCWSAEIRWNGNVVSIIIIIIMNFYSPVSNTKCHSIGHKMRIARIKIRVDSQGRWEKSLGRESNFEEVCFEPGTEYW